MYMVVPSEGELMPAEALLNAAFCEYDDEGRRLPDEKRNLRDTFNDVNLKLSNHSNVMLHWTTQFSVNNALQTRASVFKPEHVNYGKNQRLRYIEVIVFVDRIFPSYLSTLFRGR